jgi:pSer/pThr/pTyr-binding forkhead associated (FHA) protein
VKLLVEWGSESAILEPERTYTVGRDQSCDIALDNSRVSKTHLRLSWEDGDWKATDLESTNGTFLNSKLSRVTKISDSKVLHLGGVNNVVIKLSPLTGAQSTKSKVTRHILEKEATQVAKNFFEETSELQGPRRIRLQQRIRIGRGEGNDWKIEDINVSRSHAEIVQHREGGYELVDLKSTNGTFLNENKIKREKLIFGDIISIGGYRRKFTSDGLEILEGIEGLSVSVKSASFMMFPSTWDHELLPRLLAPPAPESQRFLECSQEELSQQRERLN